MTIIRHNQPGTSSSSRILVFADQAAELEPSLQRLLQCAKRLNVLDAFLRAASKAICESAVSVPEARSVFPSETALVDLCRGRSALPIENVIARTVCLTLNQLGWLLWEACHEGHVLRPSRRKIILASCTGTIAGVAAAAAQSVSSLLEIVVPTLLTSFWVGVEALRRSKAIDLSDGSWTISVNVPVNSIEKSLKRFNISNNIPLHRHAYLSALAPNTVSISGPPSTLQLLKAKWVPLQDHRVADLPVQSAFHAPHLQQPDLDSMLAHVNLPKTTIQDMEFFMPDGHLVGGRHMNARALMKLAIRGIFQQVQRIDAMIRGLPSCIGTDRLDGSFIGAELPRWWFERWVTLTQVQELVTQPEELSPQRKSPSDMNAIAIVGMSGRFPGADDVDALWDVLMQGRDMCHKNPASRFDLQRHYGPTGKEPNTTACPYECFLENADLFDNLLFQMSPLQATQTDPVHRMLLLTPYEALEQAGYSYEGRDALSVGSFFGCTSDDWREVNAGQNIDVSHIPGGHRAIATGKLSYHFGWEGPAYTVDTACSSSAAAIDLACSALLARKCRSAIAGGGGILKNSDVFAGLSRANIVSPSGSCKTWDTTADDYCRAEAVGVVVLKRLENAIQDRDNVLAVIKSSVTNHSPNASSITHSHAEQQPVLVQQVLDAAVRPGEFDHVEMHGTGTQAGDVAEASSMNNLFHGHRSAERPLHIGTVKPSVGHSEAASGIPSVIKAALMLKNSVMPPHVGIKTHLNPSLPDLAASSIQIPFEPTPFSPHQNSDGKRRILVNNFNITSGSTTILLEDGFKPTATVKDSRSHHVVAVSANCETSLQASLRRLQKHIARNPDLDLANLAYTTTARRMHHSHRRAFTVESLSDLSKQIGRHLNLSPSKARASPNPPVIFVFTGQASQFIGSGRRLFEDSSAFRKSLLGSEAICKNLQLPPFIDVLRQDSQDRFEPIQVHLALAALQIALAAIWQTWGVKPSAVIGHSLGEYAALCVAGVYSASDMFYLIGCRARLLQQHCTAGSHGMLAVHMDVEGVREILHAPEYADSCEIACYNGPSAHVISGPVDVMLALEAELKQKKIASKRVSVPYAFQSEQMDCIVEGMRTAAASVVFRPPKIPVASTVLGRTVTDGFASASYVSWHARTAVRFDEAVRDLEVQQISDENTLWLELGPSRVCLNMIQGIQKVGLNRQLPSILPDGDIWKSIGSSLAKAYAAGVEVKWQAYHREYENALCLLDLPS